MRTIATVATLFMLVSYASAADWEYVGTFDAEMGESKEGSARVSQFPR